MFDYSGDTVETRLSVFANVKSDLDLAAEIRLVNEEAGLEWTCRELTKFQDTAKNDWAGYAAFVSPEGEGIAKGKYILTYEDSCEREGDVVFVVDYPDALLEKLASEEENEPSQEEGDSTDSTDDESDGSEAASDEDGAEDSATAQDVAVQAARDSAHQTPMPQDDIESEAPADQGQSPESTQKAVSQAAHQDDEAAAQESEEDEAQEEESEDEEKQLELGRRRRDVFKSKTFDEVKAILGKGAKKKIALYSAEHELLYFGEQEDDTLSHYKDAIYLKTCLCTQDDAVICVFAETPVVRPKNKR